MDVLLALMLTLKGVHCVLQVSPAAPPPVNALAGSNLTLEVTLLGATDPVLRWFMGPLPVVTWTVGSEDPADISRAHRHVLHIQPSGSLSFTAVTLGYSNSYKAEITKSGLVVASTVFVLRVYESFQNVTLDADPERVVEGGDGLTLRYSAWRGVADQATWFFDGAEIQNNSRYAVEPERLRIRWLLRGDTGRYTLVLRNPFSQETLHKDVSVLYGPDEPELGTAPVRPFYESGDSVLLSCQAAGVPRPTATWMFGGETLPDSHNGTLNLTGVRTAQGGVYTCVLRNEMTGARRQKNTTVHIYERPSGAPVCSVQSVNNSQLQYRCDWLGGVPAAQLSFLEPSGGAADVLVLNVEASEDLDGTAVVCVALHPLQGGACNVTARKPAAFLPQVTTDVDPDGRIAVTVRCFSEAWPPALVSWTQGDQVQVLSSGTNVQFSADSTELTLRHFNISASLSRNYTCTCHNPLGRRRRETLLIGPTISDSSLFTNQDGSVVTLTWEVPPASVVSGFDIQMKGPDLLSDGVRGSGFRSVQRRPGSARSADVLVLDPSSTYHFRVVPSAGLTVGAASEVLRTGPGGALSGAAVAGIAAGVPCSLLLLLLLVLLLVLLVRCYKKNRGRGRYPVSRGVEKAVMSQQDLAPRPHHLLTGGLHTLPDYNKLQQAPSERSLALPTFVPLPPPVRIATTV